MATLPDSLLLMIAAQYYQQMCECNDDYDCEESFFQFYMNMAGLLNFGTCYHPV